MEVRSGLEINRSRWSEEERAFLLENAEKMPDDEISKALNRGIHGVRMKRKELGLKSWAEICREQRRPVKRLKRVLPDIGLSIDAARANNLGLHYGEYMFRKENGLL